MTTEQLIRPIHKVTQKELARCEARFTLTGLRLHCEKLTQFTNPTGGGLDKIPLNTIAYEQLYKQQFEPFPVGITNPLDHWDETQSEAKTRPYYLRKKAKYHVANHLLGIGKVAYWTGSKGRSTLLGLDIDDHESIDPALVEENSAKALDLFTEMTGWYPVTCRSSRGIHGFLILDKGWLTAQAANETWHGIVRYVQAEGKRRALAAKLECKGKARIVTADSAYGGVLLKDPFNGLNPTDAELTNFWDILEQRRLSDTKLQDMLTTLASLDHEATISTGSQHDVSSQDASPSLNVPDSATKSSGSESWVKKCRKWAIHGLAEQDSMAEVVFELSKWFYFVEFWDSEENDRFNKVVDILQRFCLLRHNGYITRLNLNKTDEVLTHVTRIVRSMLTHITDSARACFSRIRTKRNDGAYSEQWFLEPLIFSSSPLSPVMLTECCSVSLNEKKKRPDPKTWTYIPDTTPLPDEMEQMIRRGLALRGAKNKSYVKIVEFLNHIKKKDGDARLGIQSLKKMGFSDHRSRQYITMLRKMGLFFEKGYSPDLGLGKQFVFTVRARQLFGMPTDEPEGE